MIDSVESIEKLQRKLRLWQEFSTNHDQLIVLLSYLFCFHYTKDNEDDGDDSQAKEQISGQEFY